MGLIQEVLPVQSISLRRPESSVADYSAQLFFGRAVSDARGSYYILFQHD
jgi:hypothetical protein